MREEARRDFERVAPRPGSVRLVHLTTVPVTLDFLRGQAAYLRRHGFEVSAVSSPGGQLDAFGEAERVACFAVPMAREISPLRDLVALARLWRLLRRLRPDIVDAHTPKAGLLGVAAAWLAGVPARVYHLHGLRFLTTRGPRRHLLIAAERLAARLATRVLCVSHSSATVASACELVPDGKLAVLLAGSINGVDAKRFSPCGPEDRAEARSELGLPQAAPVVGYVGRLVRDKGIVELAGAWSRLREELPEARLVLVGPFEEQDPVPTEVATALLADPRVLVAGEVPDPARYYRAFDVVALPTYREGLPQVALEAAAMGLPIVATRVPGCVDAVYDGVTGTLVAPRDESALAGALRAYLLDPGLRKRHGEAARARVMREFSQERIWDALRAEYEALASPGAPRTGRPAPLPGGRRPPAPQLLESRSAP